MSDNTSVPVLEIKNLTKSFGNKVAVDNIDLKVNKGEVFGFLGPNGAGKSTTVRLILDVLRADSGEIKLFGLNHRSIKQTHSLIGYLSGDMSLDADLTGGQYLSFINHLYGGDNLPRIKELVKEFRVDLRVKIGEYSRGNRQKIGLISAIMHDPELLILDEPSSGFDPLAQEQFISLVRKYAANGGTVFMSSHILSEVQQLCDRVGFIRDGEIVTVRSTEEISETAAKKIRVVATDKDGLAEIKKRASKFKGLSLNETTNLVMTYSYKGDVKQLLKFFAAQDLRDLTIQEPELEQVFLNYYKGQNGKNNDE